MISAMGRYYYGKKIVAEDCYKIDVQFLNKHGHLSPNSFSNGNIAWYINDSKLSDVSFSVDTNEKKIEFRYKSRNRYSGEEWTSKNYSIGLTTTPCNLGGERYWFVCKDCQRRVGALYLYDELDFTCRHCLDLSYESRNKSRNYRAISRYFDYEDVCMDIVYLRNKFYRGRPTRSYRKLLRKKARLERYELLLPGFH